MKTMLKCDFIGIKSTLKGILLSNIFIAVIVFIGTESTYVVIPCINASIAISLFFNLLALDEQNGWQRFRLALPLSRDDVVLGRYLSCLIGVGAAMVLSLLMVIVCIGVVLLLPAGSAVALSFTEEVLAATNPLKMALSALGGASITILMMSLALPLVAKMGLTRATKLFPMVFVLLSMFFIFSAQQYITETSSLSSGFSALTGNEMNITMLIVALFIVVLICYLISAQVAKKLYAQREL